MVGGLTMGEFYFFVGEIVAVLFAFFFFFYSFYYFINKDEEATSADIFSFFYFDSCYSSGVLCGCAVVAHIYYSFIQTNS